jgi:L-lactate utilization protein LutC
VSGAAASPFDTYANATGNLAAATGTVNGPSIAPSTSNGLVVFSSQQDGETVSVVPTGYTYTVQTDNQYQYLSLGQDGGIGGCYNPNTSAIN